MRVFVDPFLMFNWLFIKACCFIFSKSISDLVFIPNINNICIKTVHNKQSETIANVSKTDFNDMLFKLKLYAKSDLLNENHPVSFSVKLRFDSDVCWFRCSVHPSAHGSSLAIRLIRNKFFHWNESMEFKGLNIIFGPTGSGKTTLLYGIMSKFSGNIISLEDPIENELLHVCQTDVSTIGYTEYIKSAMRMNPELIVLGEIRDQCSANAAILAALTGHSVIATMHGTSMDHIFLRMQQMNCMNFESVINKLISVSDYRIKSIIDCGKK